MKRMKRVRLRLFKDSKSIFPSFFAQRHRGQGRDAKGNPNWIHVSYTTERPNRRQLLTCIKGHYFNGWLTKGFETVQARAMPMK